MSNKTDCAEKKTVQKGGALLYILSLIYGIIFSELVIRGGCEFGALATTGIFYAFFLPFVAKKGVKMRFSAWLSVAVVIVMAIGCAFFAPSVYKVFTVLTLLALQLLQLPLLCGYSASPFFSFKNIAVGLYSIFISPFENLAKAYSSLGKKNSENKQHMGTLVKILLGLVISIPFVAVLVFLFSGADEIFDYTITYIFEQLEFNWSALVTDLVLGTIISLWVFPWIYGYHIANGEKSVSEGFSFKGLDSTVFATVIFACDAVYLLFVYLQFAYLFPHNMQLPIDTNYAEYCRSGFFTLFPVTLASFGIAVLALLFSRKNKKGGCTFAVKLSLIILILSDFVVAYSAMYRFAMYVDAYGLSRSRVIVGWLIVTMALLTFALLIKVIFNKARVSSFIGVISVVMVLVLSFANVDALIARVNISRYLDYGKDLDYYYLTSDNLSSAAVPEIMRLYNEGNKEDKKKAALILASYYDYNETSELGELNHQDYAAKNMLKSNNIHRYKSEQNLDETIDELLIACPYDYCGDNCTAGRYYHFCDSCAYCNECGTKYCAYCYNHECEEAQNNNYIECYCEDCDNFAYSWGDNCYCDLCGKKLK